VKQIILVRHGENDFGKKRLAGRLPGVVLNANGQEQANQVAAYLSPLNIAAIYSSPIERAQQTAQPLCRCKSLPLRIDDGLIEIDYGDFQGKSYRQLRRIDLWKSLASQPLAVRFPGGETFTQACERAVAAVEGILATLQDNQTAVCFTHADVIRLVLTHYLCMPLGEFQRLHIDQGSLTVIVVSASGVIVPHINLVLRPFAGFVVKESRSPASKK
jgi:probable phosphoglycerate mutase